MPVMAAPALRSKPDEGHEDKAQRKKELELKVHGAHIVEENLHRHGQAQRDSAGKIVLCRPAMDEETERYHSSAKTARDRATIEFELPRYSDRQEQCEKGRHS